MSVEPERPTVHEAPVLAMRKIERLRRFEKVLAVVTALVVLAGLTAVLVLGQVNQAEQHGQAVGLLDSLNSTSKNIQRIATETQQGLSILQRATGTEAKAASNAQLAHVLGCIRAYVAHPDQLVRGCP